MKKLRELTTYLSTLNSNATRKAYEKDINQFLEFMINVHEDVGTIDLVNFYHANSFIEKLQNEKLAKKTINRKLSSNVNFFEFLISEKIIRINPWVLIERLDEVVQNPTVTVRFDDVEKLLDAIDNNEEVSLLHQAVLFTLFTTGIKKGELIKLRAEDFQEKNNMHFLIIKGKYNAPLSIKLSSKCASKIERYLNEVIMDKLNLEPSSWLFRPSKNPLDNSNLNKAMNPKSIDYIVKTWWKRTGLSSELSTHSARKTHLAKEIEETPSPKIICEKFGIAEQTYFRYKLDNYSNRTWP